MGKLNFELELGFIYVENNPSNGGKEIREKSIPRDIFKLSRICLMNASCDSSLLDFNPNDIRYNIIEKDEKYPQHNISNPELYSFYE